MEWKVKSILDWRRGTAVVSSWKWRPCKEELWHGVRWFSGEIFSFSLALSFFFNVL
jgi:hypothetical protein